MTENELLSLPKVGVSDAACTCRTAHQPRKSGYRPSMVGAPSARQRKCPDAIGTGSMWVC